EKDGPMLCLKSARRSFLRSVSFTPFVSALRLLSAPAARVGIENVDLQRVPIRRGGQSSGPGRGLARVTTYLTDPAFDWVLLAALPQHIAVSLWLTVSPG